MSQEVDFILVFEDDHTGKKEEFLQLLKRNWADKVKVGENTIYGHEVRIRTDRFSEPAYMVFHLYVLPYPPGRTSVLHFSTDTMDDDSESPDFKLFYDIFFTACQRLKPVFGTANETEEGNKRRPVTDEAEYYRNPYMFCLEPPLFDNGDFDAAAFHSFLHNEGLATKLAEIGKVMSRSELVEIIRKHCERVVESDDGGVGVLKNGWQAVRPRYFIRQELSRMGIKLEDGLAEEYARQSGIKP